MVRLIKRHGVFPLLVAGVGSAPKLVANALGEGGPDGGRSVRVGRGAWTAGGGWARAP